MGGDGLTTPRPTLSVVVPVFNQVESILRNLEVIHERVAAGLDEPFEIVVVSDGSIDETEEQLAAQASAGAFRVFHYDRNLGKGYAVKLGALEARGDWIGFVDADLDLDPAALPEYVRVARDHGLDFAIASKRHPLSRVVYPRSRVIASWVFQQLVRALFRLNVRDTQAGLKVFRRDVAEQVLPLLLVKRYAFDIELLAVARAFGFSRIEELPITLDYQFTGSGVRSRAVLRALIDTAAIFYRLRILRYYQRRRRALGAYAFTRPREAPTVSVLLPRGQTFREQDIPVEVIEVELGDAERATIGAYRPAAAGATGEIVALLRPGVRAAGNWLSATTPFLSRKELGAVVTPTMAPITGGPRAQGAAAVLESRVGAGLGYYRHTPGNIRYVSEFPASAVVVRRDVLRSVGDDLELDEVVAGVAALGLLVLYTPESVVVEDPPTLFASHLASVWRRAAARGAKVRRGSMHVKSWPVVLAIGVALLAGVGLLYRATDQPIAIVAIALYGAAVLGAAAAAAFRHQSLGVGALVLPGIVATHVTYAVGLVWGMVSGR